MLEVNITDEMLHAAKIKTEKVKQQKSNIPSKFGYSHDRILIGYLGEQLVKSYIKEAKEIDGYQYDLICNNVKLEVKTISCKFKPKDYYLCTVNSHDDNKLSKQEADYYIFTRILNDMTKGWILGYISCKEFYEIGMFISKGSKVTDGIEFTKANATCLEISKLHKVL
jgi:hypothetical protein